MAWPTAGELEELVARFLDRTLPKPSWTHEAHLAVGLWHVRTYGQTIALPRLRTNIRRLNDAHGTENSDTSGYHETITAAYVRLIAAFAAANASLTDDECVRRLLASPVARRDRLLAHYSTGRLFSIAARRGWLEPDREPLPLPADRVPQP
jgi:hypothetical protein